MYFRWINNINVIFICTLCGIQRKPTRKQAHLVFANTKANAEKPKEPVFIRR